MTSTDSSPTQLQEWAQSALASLYSLDQDPPTQTLFTSDAQITINDEAFTPDTFHERLSGLRGAASRVNISWEEARATLNADSDSALFEGIYTITRSLKLRLRAAPMQSLTHAKVQAQLVGPGTDLKIASLSQTETYERPPVNLHPVGASGNQDLAGSNVD
ncbi:hypothetical protein BC834DRAFT_884290 [Gloeopeniophorella convolvens]|nr:hypothetical protein BC834DRAFT_884290 [Gloeopeniophorella convolvens]